MARSQTGGRGVVSEEVPKEWKHGFWCGVLIAGVVGIMVCVLLAAVILDYHASMSVIEQGKAVEHGVAEWIVNPKDGTTKFTWKEVKP